MADANFTQRFGMRHELLHKVFRRGCCECLIELDDEQVLHTEPANQLNFVLRGGEQMGRLRGPKHFYRMRIESNHNGSALGGLGMFGRSGNDGLMATMHAVKDPNREEEGTG
jgi:hypothetical protein